MAGLAAGADAVYLGLKSFSARMQADNFSPSELASLVDMAHSEGRRVYVAMNTVLKPEELSYAGSLLKVMATRVKPDALIVQDLGALDLARQAGFEGELHLSTLANVTHPAALKAAASLGAKRVILPRELSIDEIKALSDACPPGLELELFVHGALCFCVSGRCYWSSYMGGKSSLRGQCVQPCRRIYKQRSKENSFFSCLDLSLDLLAKTLLPVQNVVSWKLEGRRKGPHYVYYVTTAYRMLRDNPNDPAVKKDVEELLKMALGRTGTNARFLPQNIKEPTVLHSKGEETASGMFMGRLSSSQNKPAAKSKATKPANPRYLGKNPQTGPQAGQEMILRPWHPLLTGDYFRIGNEDNPWHFTFSIKRQVPKGGSLTIMPPRGKFPPAGAPVFLLDRREPELTEALNNWEAKAKGFAQKPGKLPDFKLQLPQLAQLVELTQLSTKAEKEASTSSNPGKLRVAAGIQNIILRNNIPQGREGKPGMHSSTMQGLWLTRKTAEEVSRTLAGRTSWWLPPVIWPDEERSWASVVLQAMKRGGRHFVCNAPWQISLFKTMLNENETEEDKNTSENFKAGLGQLNLVAGPFCNTTNALAVAALARLGFSSAIVSPELSGEDMLALAEQSCLPLGAVLSGFWPVGISRHAFVGGKLNEPFSSPKREVFWARHYGQNLWIYPGWPLDISSQKEKLQAAGYKIFINIQEQLPKEVPEPARSSPFNWELGLI